MILIKTPLLVRFFFKSYLWNIKTTEKAVYLTFDDGPIPEVTEWVLALLQKEQIRATFFCIGDNVRKNPEIFQQIIQQGHTIGNHTYNHLNGFKTTLDDYLKNIKLCEEEFKKHSITSHLFRPPYGKIKSNQAIALQKKGYKIVCWDVLSYDFNPRLNIEKYYKKILNSVEKGSIIVFHDSLKAEKNLKKILPQLIFDLKKKNFSFNVLV